MKFTRIHWGLILCITLLAAGVFCFIALNSEQEFIFGSIALLCMGYALFALIRLIMCQDHQYLDEIEDELLYKAVCPACGELLAGHELYCPNCNAFLSQRTESAQSHEQ